MLYLLIRTDRPFAELFLYNGHKIIAATKWQADRQLAETINLKIDKLLKDNQANYEQLDGVGIYKGPGSFTGLRIGITIANTLAYSLKIPIVSHIGDNWKEFTLQKLVQKDNEKIITPFYGSAVRVTKPRK